MLNDITYVEASRKFAERVLREGGNTPESQIDYAFRCATSRHPRTPEQQVLLSRYRTLVDHYRQDPVAAQKLLAVGESPADKKLDAAQVAALTGVAEILFNLDETITKE